MSIINNVLDKIRIYKASQRANSMKIGSFEEKYKSVLKWEKDGSPVPPPPFVKQYFIEKYQKELKYSILVETGTYLGDMIEAQTNNFKRIISIELSETLWKRAKKKFKAFPHIELIKGDSSLELSKVLRTINEPCIFWLDGHYSGGFTALGNKICPIYDELKAILTSDFYEHLLLIDDARLFIDKDDYPTVDEVVNYVKNYYPHSFFKIAHDTIYIMLKLD